MKVLLLGTGAYPIPPPGYGAVERIIFEYAEALRNAGHKARIVHRAYGGGSISEYRFALHLTALLRNEEYDVVHASTPVVANRLRLGRIPYFYTSHSRHWFWRRTWRHRWGYWMERRAVRGSETTVAVTADVERAIRESFLRSEAPPLRNIASGVRVEGLGPAWDLRTGRRALGVGAILPLKRWDLAAAALRGSGISLRLAGPTPDPVHAQKVRAAGDDVEILGEIDEDRLRALYAESDFLLHPSEVEVLPRAVLEAMASGLPVVGSSVIRTVFPEGRGGLTAPPDASSEGLVRFLRESVVHLSEDPALRRQMGEEARSVARTTYSWERIVQAHLALYREVGMPRR